MTASSHERFEQDIGAYLLGALTDDELGAFDSHLRDCDQCRAELDRLRMAADALPRSVEPFAPPASLKRALMRTVLEEAGHAPRERRSMAERLGLGRLFSGLSPQLAVVSAAVLLVVGGAVGFGIDRLSRGGDHQRTIAAVVDPARVPHASASLVIPKGSGPAQLRVSGMPSPGPGHIYEVWLKRGDQVQRSSLFSVSAAGDGTAGIPDSLNGVDLIMVTRENGPAGAPAPTGNPILSVKT